MTEVWAGGSLRERSSYGNADGSQPNALTGWTSLSTGEVQSYGHDTRGRQASGEGRTTAYTSFDLPRTVTQGGQTWSFAHDAFGSRFRKKASDGRSTQYHGGLHEKRVTSAGAVTHVFHVVQPEGTAAEVIYAPGSRGTREGGPHGRRRGPGLGTRPPRA